MRRILFSFRRGHQERARRATGLVLVAAALSAGGCAHRDGAGGPPAGPPTGLGAGPGKDRGSDLPRPEGVRPLARARHPATVLSVVFLPEGERLLTEGDDGSIRVWKARTGEGISRYILDDGWESSRCAWGGAFLAVVWRRRALIYGVEAGKSAGMWHPGKSVHAVSAASFSPDGATPAVGTDRAGGGMIHLWEARTGRKLRGIKAHGEGAGCVGAVAFCPDGGHLVSGEGRRSGGGGIRVWDESTGADLARLEGHRGPVASLAFSRDGKLLASGGGDATALVWDWKRIRKTLP